jgi:predicted dehydrogenase
MEEEGAMIQPKIHEPLRLGVIGTGKHGRLLLSTLLAMPGLEFPALCDIDPGALGMALDMVLKAGHSKPEAYADGPEDFERLLGREDIDAVVIATPWEWHTPMAVSAMRNGKYAALEVPAALTFEECWDLVKTHEETGVPCMMLENWSFRQDNLALLNMVREGMFGDVVHVQCAHAHDCVDHWFFGPEGDMRWPGRYLIEHNRSQYPTHALGPVWPWMNLGCGDYFATAVSMASRQAGVNAYFGRKFGPEHPYSKRPFDQGDIVTTLIRTKLGNTITIKYDMQLPRPYDNQWELQGTLGVYNEQRNAIYLVGRSPRYHQWEPFPPYMEKHDHAWWRKMKEQASAAGHSGTDYLELALFLDAVRKKTQTPIDVYDSVLMSSIIPLSEKSIAGGYAPVECPDFTRGKWKTKKPAFGF